jgi:hypothetical protein
MTKTYFDSDNDKQSDSKSANKNLEVKKRQLVTRDGKHRSGTWTHIEGCYSLPNERLRQRKKFSTVIATEDDEIEYGYDDKSN